MNEAFGRPGVKPTWTTGAKSGVGTSASLTSRLWFTLSEGIINEIYYPRIDIANVRDAQFLVASENFFSEEKTDTYHEIERLEPWAPAFRITNTCVSNRYRIIKELNTDPSRNVLLQRIQFQPLSGTIEEYSLYALISPHMANSGFDNYAWVDEYNGIPMIFASRDSIYLAVMCSSGLSARSVGFEGVSDGWQDISRNHKMTWQYTSASNGNVALTGQINIPPDGKFILAIAFGATLEEAAQQAYESILKGFETCQKEYMEEWVARTKNVRDLSSYSGDGGALFRSSVQVFLSHEDKLFHGGTVASLAFPWGNVQVADGNVGGYHLIWPRDLVETATARIAIDDIEGAKQTLLYLASIQEESGGWHQNNWLDGRPFWDSVQLDETAFPIMLAWRLNDIGGLRGFNPWPMVKKAASFLVTTGPVTQEERWEEDGGYSPSTLAVAISALICAADLAKMNNEHTLAEYFNYVADWWASNIDAWTYTTNSLLDPDLPAHYERLDTIVVSNPDISDPNIGMIPIRNLSPDFPSEFPSRDVIDAGFLQLVYYGVRSAHDPHILNSIRIADKVLKVELPSGPSWKRYNHDGYGEQPNGDPFLGWGVGQAWPLLTGERAHYELAAGNIKEAKRLARAMEDFSGDHKLLPEQLWTLQDIPEKQLVRGKPSGSAMPLVWAHAEYVKLLRSIADGQAFDFLPIVANRYKAGPPLLRNIWRFNHKVNSTKWGEPIRIEVLAKARMHWSFDKWQTVYNEEMTDSGTGLQYMDILPSMLEIPTTIEFTFYWIESQRWEGTNFTIEIRPL